ncbi:UNVERIFIED_CONTAM: hypothetical protein GTU68_027777 [Idotea baltica]|nr:hypothetical protein [Idotea baltica]
MKALEDVGYETPSPIQAQMIPHVLAGRDVLGQAQTGTGKTAAFALPLLSNLDIKDVKPQVLVLTPTRELAIQVAEAFQSYAKHLKGFRVAPIYGGQSYSIQLKQLKRGLHVVVGTPGRVMDHMRRGSLDLSNLKCLVLDEADEMLKMGFVEDVEWVLEQSPEGRQIALFSATMPREIRRISKKYLNDPEEVIIKQRASTAETIKQRYWSVRGIHKLDALTRILEVEPFDAILCFVRTKTATVELAEKLNARGLAATALNGDIAQNQREQTIERLKSGKLDIVVATDVAARGLDVDRISHVINYDIPYDTEAYVHRIGRTGRAGRSGEAILFVAPRETRMLRAIERATNQKITEMELPSNVEIAKKRVAEFKEKIIETLSAKDLDLYAAIVEDIQQETEAEPIQLAAALVKLAQGSATLIAKKEPKIPPVSARDREPRRSGRRDSSTREGMQRYRLEVGRSHRVSPGNIVGAIANEGGLDSSNIGAIEIYDSFSTVDLPKDLPKEVVGVLRDVWVAGQQLKLSFDKGPKRAGSERKGERKKQQEEALVNQKQKVLVDESIALLVQSLEHVNVQRLRTVLQLNALLLLTNLRSHVDKQTLKRRDAPIGEQSMTMHYCYSRLATLAACPIRDRPLCRQSQSTCDWGYLIVCSKSFATSLCPVAFR